MELITDRTQADVTRAQELNKKIRTAWDSMDASELAEWKAGLKGAYNYTDLNRVGQAVQEIADELIAMPTELEEYRKEKEVYYDESFLVPYDPEKISVSPKTDWAMTDAVTPTAMADYLQNISNLRSIFPGGCPEVPASMSFLTFTKANDIEKILQTVYNAAVALKQSVLQKMDQAALAGTEWDKYTCTEEEVYMPHATMSNFETVFNGETDETSITGWSNYTTEWVDLPDGRRECHYIPRGVEKTIYATGQSSSHVYTFPSPYKVESHALFLIDGVAKRHTSESTVTTTHSYITRYDPDQLVGTIHTQGYAYPDGITYPTVVSTHYGKPDELVGGGYYYIRKK